MAQETLSDFQRAARLKWPGAKVSGDGSWAVFCPVIQSVALFSLYMFAANHAGNDHANWCCKAEHRVVEIKPLPIRSGRSIRWTAEMER